MEIMRMISNYFLKLFGRIAYVIGIPFVVAFMVVITVCESFIYIITGFSLMDKTCAIPSLYDKWFSNKFRIKTLNM